MLSTQLQDQVVRPQRGHYALAWYRPASFIGDTANVPAGPPSAVDEIAYQKLRGEIVVTGTPEDVVACAESYTGQFLKPVLEGHHARGTAKG